MSVCEGATAEDVAKKLSFYVKVEIQKLKQDLGKVDKVLSNEGRLSLQALVNRTKWYDIERKIDIFGTPISNLCSGLKAEYDAAITAAKGSAIQASPKVASKQEGRLDESGILSYEEFLAKQTRVREAQEKISRDIATAKARRYSDPTARDIPETVVRREIYISPTFGFSKISSSKRRTIYRLALSQFKYRKIKKEYLRTQKDYIKNNPNSANKPPPEANTLSAAIVGGVPPFAWWYRRLKIWAAKFYEKYKAKLLINLNEELKKLEAEGELVPGTLEEMRAAEKTRKEAELGKSGDFRAESPAASRLREQCYLVHHMDNFAEKASRSQRAPTWYPKFLRILDGDGATIANKLFNRDVKALMDITPVQAALLTPVIELWKVEYPPGKPPIQKPFVFEDHLSTEKVKNILQSSRGRGDGIGIQSITFDWQGTDMESAERVVMTKLVFFIQSLETFFLPEKHSEHVASPMDLIVPTKLLRKDDLWVTNKTFTYHKAVIADSLNFEIKAVIGWAVPEKNHKNIMDSSLRKALENTKLTVMLTLNNHNFDFNQDGSVVVTAEYHGRVEGLLEDDNRTSIFADSPEEKKARDAYAGKKFLSQDEAGKMLQTTLGALGLADASPVTQVKAFFESQAVGHLLTAEMKKLPWDEQLGILDKKYPDKWPELKRWKEHLKGKDELLERKDIQEAKELVLHARQEKHLELMRLIEERGGIFSVSINKKDMDEFLRVSGGNMGSWGTESKFGRKVPAPTISPGSVDLTAMTNARIKQKNKTIAAEQDAAKKGIKKLDVTQDSQLQASIAGDNYQFSYIYLGDIIDAALEIIAKKGTGPKSSRFRVIAGPLNYSNPKTGKIDKINLADVPISINLFMDWYTKNVVQEGLVKWPLIRFLRSIATNLIFPAFGGDCYESAPPISRVGRKLAFNIFSAPLDFLEDFPRKDVGDPGLANKIKEANSRWHADVPPEKIYDYILLQSNFIKPVERDGNKLLDEKDGIIHLTLGRDSGIVKEISFSRNDMPHFFESRLAQENEIDRIKHPYNADIRMIGNTFFRPGMQLYIEPSMTAMGPANSKSSVVSKLGLGGYYVILGSSMKIEGTKFETSIRAVHNSFGFFESKKNKAAKLDGEAALSSAEHSLPSSPDIGPPATPGQLAPQATPVPVEEYKKQLVEFHKLRDLNRQVQSPLYDPSQPDIPLVISEQGRSLVPGDRPVGPEADPMAGYRFRD